MTIPTSRVRELRDHCVFMTRLPVEGTALKPSDHRPVTREMMWDMARLLEAELTRRDAEAREGSVTDFISCGHAGDGPTYSCLLCGQLGTDHPEVLRRALIVARDELVQYIDLMHKLDYREYAASVEAKVAAINGLLPPAPDAKGEKLA